MKTQADKTRQHKSSLAANALMQAQKTNTAPFLEDNRPGISTQLQQKDILSQGKVVQLRRVAVSYNDSTVVGFDTENLTKSQIESLINNSSIDPKSKIELWEAIEQGDYKGGKPVHEEFLPIISQQNTSGRETQPLNTQQPLFGSGTGFGSQSLSFGIKPLFEQQNPFSFGSQPLFEEKKQFDLGIKPFSIQQNPFSFGTQPLPEQQNPFSFGTLLPMHQSSEKESIRDKILDRAKKKLQLVAKKVPEFEKIEVFMKLVSDPEKFNTKGGANGKTIAAVKNDRVMLYDAFFNSETSDQQRTDTLIHEMSHIVYGSLDYAYKWNRIFNYLTGDEHKYNPDSIVTRINNITDDHSVEAPPKTTGDDNVPEDAVNMADRAFAVLGDILEYTTNLEADEQKIVEYLKGLNADQKYHKAYTGKILFTIEKLKFYKDLFRSKNIHLKVGSSWTINPIDGRIIITLPKIDEKKLKTAVNGGTEKALLWLVFQITENVTVAKTTVKIILNAFNTAYHNRNDHPQGLFPSAIKLDPEKV